MTRRSTAVAHLAVGLDGLNLLGFLAALGALVSLSRIWRDREIRLSWTLVTSGPGAGGWRPLLHIDPVVAQQEIVEALYAHVTNPESLSAFADVDANLRMSRAVFRSKAVSLRHDRRAADLLAALVCEAGTEDEVKPTPFRALSGAGHLNFLSTAQSLSDASRLQKSDIARALFQPWTYENTRLTFRWDPVDYRAYAGRARDPADDPIHPIRTEWGANRLAFEALVMFPMIWSGEAVGVRSNEFRWPLWSPAASVDTIRSLLAHPFLFRDTGANDLASMGVVLVASCQRFTSGQRNAYVNFSPSRIVWSVATFGGSEAHSEAKGGAYP